MSHRAIYGFGIGSKIEKGNCAYVPVDKEDFVDDCIRFWSDRDHMEVHFDKEEIKDGKLGCWIKWEVSKDVPNEKMRGQTHGIFSTYPDTYGRGEWTAKTLEDAKQMAINFARGVS